MTPAFLTLTGADRADLIPAMQRLSAEHPGRIEWGILIGLAPADRFADTPALDAMRHAGLRLSAHLCGPLAEAIFAGTMPVLDLAGFSRMQVNKSDGHANAAEVENAIRYGSRMGLRTILQCAGPFPDDLRCDWLLDGSHGRGRRLAWVPALDQSRAFCGFAGGISPETIGGLLQQVNAPDLPFWLDTESALRDETGFSIPACERLIASAFRS